jgi:glutamine synthetase
MAQIRFSALEIVNSRQPVKTQGSNRPVSEFYSKNVFDNATMQKYLSKEAYNAVRTAIEKGKRIDRKIADQIASGMKSWAIEQGATHYTHWFHPLTGGTAEKHDSFLSFTDGGKVIEHFSGELLAQQEPDASSFPSGGLRNTFEARGYTAWDPSSPAFVIDNTLTIPTIFISYTGEALDNKTPLLRSIQALDKAATGVCQYFDRNVSKVYPTLGWEQEYFLVDEALFNARPDLVLAERTLLGHSSARNQQLDDHYFSSIPERVKTYMQDFENEAYHLGIPVKTRHNEVAPNQYECAPIFEEANLAVDHNLLIMELMKKLARKHHFRVILHEKPFQGINGSGKHNNWSMATNTGVNLLGPGKNPKSNMQFLTFLINVVKAVHTHSDLLRASIASAGNAHRLGANEAPPAIISVFLGQQISRMLNEIEERVSSQKMTPEEKTAIKLDIGRIPEILLDNTDRNRTSPFAFTGNRFEFRAVGSSENCASPVTALNTAIADQLMQFKKEVDKLIDKGVKKDEAIFQMLRKYIIDSKIVRFEGDNYSDDWVKEAKKRGLTNISDVPTAYDAYLTDQTINLFKRQKVLNEKEMEGRTEVRLETYLMKIQIEARILGDLAINHIIPTAVKYQTTLMENVRGLKELYDEKTYNELSAARLELIKKISQNISTVKAKVYEMIEIRKKVNKIEDMRKKAGEYSTKIAPFLEDIRQYIDELELMVDDEMWPLPKYRELIFTR